MPLRGPASQYSGDVNVRRRATFALDCSISQITVLDTDQANCDVPELGFHVHVEVLMPVLLSAARLGRFCLVGNPYNDDYLCSDSSLVGGHDTSSVLESLADLLRGESS